MKLPVGKEEAFPGNRQHSQRLKKGPFYGGVASPFQDEDLFVLLGQFFSNGGATRTGTNHNSIVFFLQYIHNSLHKKWWMIYVLSRVERMSCVQG